MHLTLHMPFAGFIITAFLSIITSFRFSARNKHFYHQLYIVSEVLLLSIPPFFPFSLTPPSLSLRTTFTKERWMLVQPRVLLIALRTGEKSCQRRQVDFSVHAHLANPSTFTEANKALTNTGLGITITNHLSMGEHVCDVIDKCAQSLYALKLLRYDQACLQGRCSRFSISSVVRIH